MSVCIYPSQTVCVEFLLFLVIFSHFWIFYPAIFDAVTVLFNLESFLQNLVSLASPTSFVRFLKLKFCRCSCCDMKVCMWSGVYSLVFCDRLTAIFNEVQVSLVPLLCACAFGFLVQTFLSACVLNSSYIFTWL